MVRLLDAGSPPRRRALAVVVAAAAWSLLLLVGCGGPPYFPARSVPPPPPAAADVDHTAGFFEGKDHVKLFEQAWRPARPDMPPRATLVIVHGLKDHSSRYAAAADRLAHEGYAVYAFDLRGHAHSEGVRVGIDSFDDYLADLDIFLGRVRAKEKSSKLFLFGHSMGGAIVTLYTIQKKPALAGLILSGAALRADVSWFKATGTRMVAALAPSSGVFNLDLRLFSRDAQVYCDSTSDPLVYPEGAPARTAKELLGAIDTIDDHMEDVTVPLLILHGAADQVTPPRGSRELYDRAHTPDKTLKIYSCLYHDLLHEPEKDQVLGDIIDWMKSR